MWYIYIVECRDSTYYTGITNDLAKRIETHNNGRGAKYTRPRLPVRLRYSEECPTKGAALKREAEIQGYNRKQKEELLNS